MRETSVLFCLTGRPTVTSRFADGMTSVGELHYAPEVTLTALEAERRGAQPSNTSTVPQMETRYSDAELVSVSKAPRPRQHRDEVPPLSKAVPSEKQNRAQKLVQKLNPKGSTPARVEAPSVKKSAAAAEARAEKAQRSEGVKSANKEDSEKEEEEEYKSCLDLVRRVPETYIRRYKRHQSIDIDGPIYAFYQWDQPIIKRDIEIQRELSHPEDCRIVFKVKDGELFIYEQNRCYGVVYSEEDSPQKRRFEKAVELILLALDMYDVPDVDFVMELEDSDRVPEQYTGKLPVLCYSLNVNATHGQGFTFPSFGAYDQALGTKQMEWYKLCLDTRYPNDRRIEKGVWRGTTTGSFFKTTTDVYENRRIALAQLGVQDRDSLEVGIVGYLQVHTDDPNVTAELERLAPIRGWIRLEDFNAFEAVIDVDGNAWSDRFSRLLSFNTPILKQEYSHWREYFSHLAEEEELVIFFKEDLSDLIPKLEEILNADESYQQQLNDQVERSFEFAKQHLSLPGVIRAMAYSLSKYASYLTWKVEMEEGYIHIPQSVCCQHNPSLPKQVVNRIKHAKDETGVR